MICGKCWIALDTDRGRELAPACRRRVKTDPRRTPAAPSHHDHWNPLGIANFTLAAVPTAAGQRDRLSWTTPGPWHSLVATVIWPRVGRAAASEDTAWAGVMGLAQPTLPMCGLCNRPPVTGPYEQTDMECRPPTLDRRASWSDQTWKATSSGLQIPASPGGLGGSAG